MNIAICDDNDVLCDSLKRDVVNCLEELNVEDYQIYTFHSGEEIIAAELVFDIAFLDVMMGGISGIDAGRELLKTNRELKVFYVTAYQDYLDEAMRHHAFRYFVKPVLKKRLLINLYDAVCAYRHANEKISIQVNGEVLSLGTKTICMLEGTSRGTLIYTKQGVIKTKVPLKSLEAKLEKYPYFIRSCRGYYVNAYHVSRLTPECIYVDDGQYKAKLTKRTEKAFREKYLKVEDYMW